jgi:hypothetical protein
MDKMIKRLALSGLLVIASASLAAAQTATPASKLAWDEAGESPAVAQAAIYNLYVDGAGVAVNLTSVSCVVQTANAANATCTAPFPPMTVGSHSLTLSQVSNGAESPKSTPLTVTFVIVVTPTGIRVVP